MKFDPPKRPQTFAEIDVDALRSNIRILQSAVGPGHRVILVIKSDAYGHGAGAVAAVAAEAGITNFAVASVDEGVQLRRADVQGEILILHPPTESEIPEVVDWSLSPSVSSVEQAALFSRLAGTVTLGIQIELNTGLSRLGLNWESAVEEISQIVALPNLRLAGLYTHYRAHLSPIGDSMQEQTDRFKQVLDALKRLGINPGLRHAASSYPAAFHHDVTLFDAIRVGIIAYGAMEPLPEPLSEIAPVMSVRSSVLHRREIKAGEWIHYGDGFQATRDMRIAAIPIGYGMGYTRHLSNIGEMLVGGRRCPIVGVVGMDLTMIDVSAMPSTRAGDPVTILGRQGGDEITALEIARKTGTIAYEITCRLGNALPRYLVNQDRSVTAPSDALKSRT